MCLLSFTKDDLHTFNDVVSIPMRQIIQVTTHTDGHLTACHAGFVVSVWSYKKCLRQGGRMLVFSPILLYTHHVPQVWHKEYT
jgi:hypothetical protein